MKKTKTFFETAEMDVLSSIVADCTKMIDERGVEVDDAKHREILQRVIEIASQGLSDPEEIRELVLARILK